MNEIKAIVLIIILPTAIAMILAMIANKRAKNNSQIDYKKIEEINNTIKKGKEDKVIESDLISDGWHTFGELYQFRKMYNAALFNEWGKDLSIVGHKDNGHGRETPIYRAKYSVHKSWKHNDGEYCFGNEKKWFIVSALTPYGLISNHYKAEDWDLFHKVPVVDKALFSFDGHTGQDVISRLENTIKFH